MLIESSRLETACSGRCSGSSLFYPRGEGAPLRGIAAMAELERFAFIPLCSNFTVISNRDAELRRGALAVPVLGPSRALHCKILLHMASYCRVPARPGLSRSVPWPNERRVEPHAEAARRRRLRPADSDRRLRSRSRARERSGQIKWSKSIRVRPGGGKPPAPARGPIKGRRSTRRSRRRRDGPRHPRT